MNLLEIEKEREKSYSEKEYKKTNSNSHQEIEKSISDSIKESENYIFISKKWSNNFNASRKIARVILLKKGNVKTKEIIEQNEVGNILNIIEKERNKTIKVKQNGKLYLLRKTTLNIAKAITHISIKIGVKIGNIVGYLITLSGSTYLMEKIRKATKYLKSISDLESFNLGERENLIEKMIYNLIELGKHGLFLSEIKTSNIMVDGDSVILTDLRKIRMTSNPKTIYSPIISFMKKLFLSKNISKNSLGYLLTILIGGNYLLSLKWYKAMENKEPKDDVEILELMEKMVTN